MSYDLADKIESIKHYTGKYSINILGDTIKEYFGESLVYQSGDSIKTIILDINNVYCICEFTFANESFSPLKKSIIKRNLTEKENKILINKIKIKKDILDEKYNIIWPHLKFADILLPINDSFKYYLIDGNAFSSHNDFNNDYLFITDTSGNIKSNHTIHSRVITSYIEIPKKGWKCNKIIFKHHRIQKFITASDICAFKLFAKLWGITEFSVYSNELSIFFIYDLKKDKIKIKKV